MKTVMVTGGSGFVGRQTLGPLVEYGFHVIAIARKPLPEITGVTWEQADLLDDETRTRLIERHRPEGLIHAAWYAVPGKFWETPENEAWLAASMDLARIFAQFGGQRALFVGSCAEYDWQRTDETPWRETDREAPHTLYGKTKLALLHTLQSEADTMQFSLVWARLFLLFGPHEPPEKLVASICRGLSADEPVLCSSGRQVRDFSDVRDVGRMLAELFASDAEGVVNVASGLPVTIAEVAQTLGRIAGKPDLIRLGALPDREGEPPYMVADTEKLRRWVQHPIPGLKARLAETYAQCQGLFSRADGF